MARSLSIRCIHFVAWCSTCGKNSTRNRTYPPPVAPHRVIIRTAKSRDVSLPFSMSADNQLTAGSELSNGRVLESVQRWAHELGFQQAAVAEIQLEEDEARLDEWLDNGFHGTMSYMKRHGKKRVRPDLLVPGTLSVISLRMDYMTQTADEANAALQNLTHGYVSRYALGRDYHKTLRSRLKRLALRIEKLIGPFGYRVFTDSAPVLERALARKAGLGWVGKHTNLIARHDGSLFFLGEIFTDLPLKPDPGFEDDLCGTCSRCIDVCPTKAIVAPYKLDARRCISYLTIEFKGSIPKEFRPMIGNRIFGCDDCQLACPWNRYAKISAVADFNPRHGLDAPELVGLFAMNESEFDEFTRGSAIRRISHEQWLRNLAIALGNAPSVPDVIAALQTREEHPSALVREHVDWALARHNGMLQ